MKSLIYDIIPCWFELSWLPIIRLRRRTPTIILRIHNNLQALFPSGGIAPIQGELDFLRSKKTLIKSVQGFTNFLIPLPSLRKTTGLPCEECDGTGYRFDDIECFSCEGSGQGVELDFAEVNHISEKLALLTTFLYYPPDEETNSASPQLLSVETMFKQDMHGSSLWGKYSVPLVNWLGGLGRWKRTELLEMVRAMRIAYTHMAGRVYSDIAFQAVVENNRGWLNVSCPGNACDLNPDSHEWKHGEGYEFSSHNVDSPIQQLTLLAGLAALHDWARKEIT